METDRDINKPVEQAVAAFEREGLNCAQSILRAFRAGRHVSDDDILRAKRLGGGRADGGRCGALHSALQLAGDSPLRDVVRTAFASETGSEECREIRRAARVSCTDCVRLAARLLATHADTQDGGNT